MYTPIDWEKVERQAARVVRKHATVLRSIWNVDKAVTFKKEHEPVTDYDVNIENNLRQDLHIILPEAGFLVEEGECTNIKDTMWLVDPIDQTRNFIGGLPLFYTQLAVTHKGQPVVSVIYNPMTNQLFSASLTNGVKINGKKHTRPVWPPLEDSVIDIEFGGNNLQILDWKLTCVKKLAQVSRRIRLTGGAFAPYVITSGIDVYISINENTKVMDQIPRQVIMRELGMISERVLIGENVIYLAARSEIFDQILQILQTE